LEKNLPLNINHPYYRNAIGTQGSTQRVMVYPYCHPLKATARDRISSVLHDIFGSRSTISIQPAVSYGDNATAENDIFNVVIFSLSQTPEAEVQATYAAMLHGNHHKALILVDKDGWRANNSQIS